MLFTRKLLTTFIATVAVFFLVNRLFGQYLVFGNISISWLQALLTASFGVALIASVVKPILHDDFAIELSDKAWTVVYLVANMGTIYLMTRTTLSNAVGMGVTGFWVSVMLGVVITAAQYGIFKDPLHPKKSSR